jgi:hypothetical protein
MEVQPTMVKRRHPESDLTYEAVTPESGVDGVARRAIDYLGLGRRGRGKKRRAEEPSPMYYDICGRVSAEGLDKLITALQAVDVPVDDLALKRRAHDPYDAHHTELNGWTDLSV